MRWGPPAGASRTFPCSSSSSTPKRTSPSRSTPPTNTRWQTRASTARLKCGWCWSLYYGFDREISLEEFSRRVSDGTLTEVLRKVPVKAGDVFFIPSGTLHAIGAGLVIAEIQQNSNVTYRVFDYGRQGPDGKPRALHVEKALAVTDRRPAPKLDFGEHLGSCRYFTTDGHQGAFQGNCDETSFHALLVTEGEGKLTCGGETQPVKKGQCFFLPAGSGAYRVDGNCRTLTAYVGLHSFS